MPAADVPEGTHVVLEVGRRQVGLFNVGGRFYALPNVCFHQNGPLCRGAVSGTVVAGPETDWKHAWSHEGEIVICPWHFVEYNVTTGQCVNYPNRRLPLYRVEAEGELIRVYARVKA